MSNAKIAANSEAPPTRKCGNNSPKIHAPQAREQAEAAIAAAQLVHVLQTYAGGVRTVQGLDGKPIRQLQLGSDLAGLFFELPPDETEEAVGTADLGAAASASAEHGGDTAEGNQENDAEEGGEHSGGVEENGGEDVDEEEDDEGDGSGDDEEDDEESPGDTDTPSSSAGVTDADRPTTFAVRGSVLGYFAENTGWYRATVVAAVPGPRGVAPEQGERYNPK